MNRPELDPELAELSAGPFDGTEVRFIEGEYTYLVVLWRTTVLARCEYRCAIGTPSTRVWTRDQSREVTHGTPLFRRLEEAARRAVALPNAVVRQSRTSYDGG